ncbi:hypothetical protein CYMTET_36255, partial [Cymbomonas tetramitiformis]
RGGVVGQVQRELSSRNAQITQLEASLNGQRLEISEAHVRVAALASQTAELESSNRSHEVGLAEARQELHAAVLQAKQDEQRLASEHAKREMQAEVATVKHNLQTELERLKQQWRESQQYQAELEAVVRRLAARTLSAEEQDFATVGRGAQIIPGETVTQSVLDS